MIQIGQPITNIFYYVMYIDDMGEGVHCMSRGQKVAFSTWKKARRYVRRQAKSSLSYRIVKRQNTDTTFVLDPKGK